MEEVVQEQELWVEVTEKDIEIENKLTELVKTFPGAHSVYAEEMHDTFVQDENVWIIDPISNTTNFIHGMPHYSVVLSHMYKGELKFAVVYDPSNKELFTAEKGKGAFLNGKKIHVSNRTDDLFFLIGPHLNVKSPYTDKTLKLISLVSHQDTTIRILGSLGVHYAYVACGRVDIAISFNKDTFPEFAGKLLVEEAGGKFTDFDGGNLHAKTVGIIATNGLVHEQIKDLMKAVV